MTYFLVNSVTVAAAFALANRRDIFRVVARQLSLEHHELRSWRDSRRRRRRGLSTGWALADVAQRSFLCA